MQKKLLMTFVLIVAVVLCAANIRAQQTNPTAVNTQAADDALREKAFDLLKSLAGQLGTLQSAENRARIGSNIAESLWINDERRARELFAVVEEDIRAGLRPPEVNDWEDTQTFLVFLQLRGDTIARIAKHDPELALAFLKRTELSSDIKLKFGLVDKDRQLEIHLAKQVASSNPDLALQLARKSLANGFSSDLSSVLHQLNRKHKDHALVLYKEIVQKLSGADFAEDWGARSAAVNLVSTFTPPATAESTFRELVGMFIDAAVANGCTTQKTSDRYVPDLCRMIGTVLPHIRKIDPARATQLKQWETQRRFPIQTQGPSYYEMQALLADGTVDEIFAFASQYPGAEDRIYMQAIATAQDKGDFELARKIASDPRLTPETRRMMLSRLDEDEARASLNAEKLAEELKHLGAFPQPKDRVSFLLSLANRTGPDQRKAALKLLNEASEIIDSIKSGREQDEAQVRLAILYCLQRSDRGLAMMESIVPKLNELVAAAAKLDGYGTRYLRDGEWNMTGEGQLGSFLTWLAAHVSYFAWCDFDRAVSLAGQFERAEIRMMAQLKLAQGILAGSPKHLRFNMGNY